MSGRLLHSICRELVYVYSIFSESAILFLLVLSAGLSIHNATQSGLRVLVSSSEIAIPQSGKTNLNVVEHIYLLMFPVQKYIMLLTIEIIVI